jgi:hypothetical protein
MPTKSAEAHDRQSTEQRHQTQWSKIGINAVAAASICKTNGKTPRQDNDRRKAFPLAETDFATD